MRFVNERARVILFSYRIYFSSFFSFPCSTQKGVTIHAPARCYQWQQWEVRKDRQSENEAKKNKAMLLYSSRKDVQRRVKKVTYRRLKFIMLLNSRSGRNLMWLLFNLSFSTLTKSWKAPRSIVCIWLLDSCLQKKKAHQNYTLYIRSFKKHKRLSTRYSAHFELGLK